MNIKDRLVAHAANNNRNIVMFSSFAQIANSIKVGDITVDINQEENSINFKYQDREIKIITDSAGNFTKIEGLDYISSIPINNLGIFWGMIKLFSDGVGFI
jgi:hypothetical protein